MKFKDLLNSVLTYTPDNEYEFNLIEDTNINNKNYENISPNIDKDAKVFPSLSVNLEYMKIKYNTLINSDIILREFTLNARGKQYNAFIVYIDGMVDSELMDKFVLEPLMMRNKNNLFEGSQNKVISEAVTNNITVRKVKKFDLSNYLMGCLMPQNSVKEVTKFDDIANGINSR
ncbi:MAG: spore germination protein [Clostridia bacterium]|nr:spore germination protein [Clostridia bacterium]MCI8273963.1 spore germination protein [Clostridia bacterium]